MNEPEFVFIVRAQHEPPAPGLAVGHDASSNCTQFKRASLYHRKMCAALCVDDLQENRDEAFSCKRLSKGDICDVCQSHGCTDRMTLPHCVYATSYRIIRHPVEEPNRGHQRI